MPFSRFACALALLPAVSLALSGCGQQQPQAQGAPPPPQVTVAQPMKKQVVDEQEFVGRFLAVDAVEVRARV